MIGWSAWHKNPFAAIKEIATPEQYEKACKILADAVLWDIMETDMLMDDVMDDIAEDVSIVIRQRCQGEHIVFSAMYVTETN